MRMTGPPPGCNYGQYLDPRWVEKKDSMLDPRWYVHVALQPIVKMYL